MFGYSFLNIPRIVSLFSCSHRAVCFGQRPTEILHFNVKGFDPDKRWFEPQNQRTVRTDFFSADLGRSVRMRGESLATGSPPVVPSAQTRRRGLPREQAKRGVPSRRPSPLLQRKHEMLETFVTTRAINFPVVGANGAATVQSSG